MAKLQGPEDYPAHVIESFQTMRHASDDVLAAHEMVAAMQATIATDTKTIDGTQQDFLFYDYDALQSGRLAEEFDDEGQYFRFLARAGRNQHIDPEEAFATTAQTTTSIGQLSTPGTIVAAYTTDYESCWSVKDWTLGSVLSGLGPAVHFKDKPGREAAILTLRGALSNSTGQGQALEVSVDELAKGFDTSQYPHESLPFVAIGKQAVAKLVENNLFDYDNDVSAGRQQVRGGTAKDKFVRALSFSGLRLAELDFSQDQIMEERQFITRRLADIIQGHARFSNEVFRFAPTCDSNRQAVELILQEMPNDDAAWDIDPYFYHHFEALKNNLEPSEA